MSTAPESRAAIIAQAVAEGWPLKCLGLALGGVSRQRAEQLIKASGLTETWRSHRGLTEPHFCIDCGKRLSPRSKARCRACYQMSRQRQEDFDCSKCGQEGTMRTCVACGAGYKPYRSWQRFCTRLCRWRTYNRLHPVARIPAGVLRLLAEVVAE